MNPMLIKTILLDQLFSFVVKHVTSDENVKELRKTVREKIEEIVKDTSNPYDDEVAKIVLKVLGFTDDNE